MAKRLATSVTLKAVQDRRKRIQGRFDVEDRGESVMCAVEIKMVEVEELWNIMKNTRDD